PEEVANTLRLNRAQAYLKLGNHYEAAIEDAAFVVDHSTGNPKAHWRLAMGQYEARQFAQCRKSALMALQAVSNADIDGKNFKKDIEFLLERVNRRLKEQTAGAYNFGAMRKLAYKDGLRDLDFADYLSRSVEIRKTENMGFGVFAKKDIKCGELI